MRHVGGEKKKKKKKDIFHTTIEQVQKTIRILIAALTGS